MARTRLIRPEFFDSKAVSNCSFPAQLLFISLWTQADRDGILKDLPLKIHGEAFPYHPKLKVDLMLKELENQKLIQRYEAEGKQLLIIHGFLEHQKPHRDEKGYNFPKPLWDNRTAQHGEKPCSARLKTGQKPAPSISISTSISNSNSNSMRDDDKISLFMKAWKEMKLSDPLSQLKYDPEKLLHFGMLLTKMRNWIETNPAKKNYKRFITNWINRDLENIGKENKKDVKRSEAKARIDHAVQLHADNKG